MENILQKSKIPRCGISGAFSECRNPLSNTVNYSVWAVPTVGVIPTIGTIPTDGFHWGFSFFHSVGDFFPRCGRTFFTRRGNFMYRIFAYSHKKHKKKSFCAHLGNGCGNAMLHSATTVPTIGRPFGVRKFLGKWRS